MVKKVIKLSASWCSPCKAYAKTFEEVSRNEEFKDISFEEIDIEENDNIAEKYKVRSVPTTVILDESENVLNIINGNISRTALETAIKQGIS